MPLDSTTFAPSVLVTDLMAGRDYIVQNGWCQHASRDGLRACLFGGVFAVTPGAQAGTTVGSVRRQEGVDALQRALDAKVGRVWLSGAMWNDCPGRTVEEVLAIYDLAIERELCGCG